MRQALSTFHARQTMNNREFEVFHYKDVRPEGIMLHNHDFYEVYLFLDGAVEYQIENTIYPLVRGDMLLVSPMELHRPISHKGEYERIVLWISRPYLRGLEQEHHLELEQCFNPNRTQHTNLLRLNREYLRVMTVLMDLMLRETATEQYGSDTMRQCSLIQILTLINRLVQQPDRAGDDLASDDLVDAVYAHINQNIAGDLSLAALSNLFYVDTSTLSRRFKKQLGATIPDYVRHKRLTMARIMLLEGERPTMAAQQCGYSDYSSFFRAFRRQYGTSPKEFVHSMNERNG